MRIASWNVNGLRAILKKDFLLSIEELQPDVLCLQEIKAKVEQLPHDILPKFPLRTINSATRPGYSGTAIFSKETFIDRSDLTKTQEALIDPSEGRVTISEFSWFFLVNVYTPNSGPELLRLPFRSKTWDIAFLELLKKLEKEKPVIACGDFNVAHQEIDLFHPENNHFSAGFTDEERLGMSRYIQGGFVDVYRHFYPLEKGKGFTWWSYRAGARSRNVGWRIDYFLASSSLVKNIQSVGVCQQLLGSDHAPIFLDIVENA